MAGAQVGNGRGKLVPIALGQQSVGFDGAVRDAELLRPYYRRDRTTDRGKPMTSEELMVQLIGRVATLEHLLSQTMVLALLDHPSPVEVLSVFEGSFEGAVGDLEAVLPEAAPAAVEAAERMFSRVRNELG